MTGHQYRDWEPLRRFLHIDNDGDAVTAEEVGVRVGVDRRTVERWKVDGRLTRHAADQAAHLLGVHPTMIWPDTTGDPADDPKPAPAHQLDAHVDRDTEHLLDRRGHPWDLVWVKVVDVDWDATTAAVVRPIDPVIVDRYTEAVRAGEAFPAVLAAHGDDGYIILGGQHRLRAWDDAGVTEIPAYVADIGDPSTRYLIAVEHNARHGAAFTEDQRIEHALAMIESHGLTQGDAARRMGVTVYLIQRALKARNCGAIVTRLGLKGSWRTLSPTSQWRIGMACARHDTLFMEAVTTARNLDLDTGGVYEMCAAVGAGWRDGGDLAGALQALEDFEEVRRGTGAGAGGGGVAWGRGAGAGGVPVTGVHRFRDLARMIVAGDPDAIVASCVPADRAITVDLLRRAAGRIAEVAAALNRAAAGEGR